MADDKNGREKQAGDADRRQRERDIVAERERGAEPEPPVEATDLDDFESELEELEFPATGAEIVATVGEREIETDDGSYTIEEPCQRQMRKRSTRLIQSECRSGDRPLLQL